MKVGTGSTPRLKNLDDLFQLNDGINPFEQPVADKNQPTESIGHKQISSMAIESLKPFQNHPFRLYEGERLDDMVHSIKKNGVLVPLLVRRIGNVFEILSGHNRVNAAKIAGLDRVPVIVLENISDEEAWVYVIETNLMQRSFSDMSHSEKAAVIAIQHSKLFSQGKRNDIINKLKELDNPHDNKANETCAQVGHKLNARGTVALEYSLARNTVARYLRIHQLTIELKVRLDNDEIKFLPAVDLSYLKEVEQALLEKSIALNAFKVDMKKAELLRQYSEAGKLNEDSIYLILSGEVKTAGKKRNSYSFKMKPRVYKKYFANREKAQEVEATIEKALDFYFQHHQEDMA